MELVKRNLCYIRNLMKLEYSSLGRIKTGRKDKGAGKPLFLVWKKTSPGKYQELGKSLPRQHYTIVMISNTGLCLKDYKHPLGSRLQSLSMQ